MADIKTILRELNVILGYLISAGRVWVSETRLSVGKFIDAIKSNVKNCDECMKEFDKINELGEFNTEQLIVIKNGILLGKLIFDKLRLNGDILWLGGQVKNEYPTDIKIGEIEISLKEDIL